MRSDPCSGPTAGCSPRIFIYSTRVNIYRVAWICPLVNLWPFWFIYLFSMKNRFNNKMNPFAVKLFWDVLFECRNNFAVVSGKLLCLFGTSFLTRSSQNPPPHFEPGRESIFFSSYDNWSWKVYLTRFVLDKWQRVSNKGFNTFSFAFSLIQMTNE